MYTRITLHNTIAYAHISILYMHVYACIVCLVRKTGVGRSKHFLDGVQKEYAV